MTYLSCFFCFRLLVRKTKKQSIHFVAAASAADADDDDDDDDNVCRHQDRPVNSADIDYFYSQSSNERVPCDAIPDMNFEPWAEAPPSPPDRPPVPQPQAPAHAEPRQAAVLHRIVAKSAGDTDAAIENFLKEVAPERRKPVFRKHSHGA